MNADGSRLRQLVDSPGLDDKPQWSPDGSRIGFATTRSGSPELLAVDPETGEEETLFPRPTSGLNPPRPSLFRPAHDQIPLRM
jgi:Tol biopolymer transport system component